ncbi:MAG: class I SAM-dependent methyltransferase, partial [Chloroflexota bacterium]|nr:class I SAM-dependent methyltransferase [Chloroflexota bacterium]
RINATRFLLRVSAFIQTLPVLIMKPDDLVEFSRQSYARPADIESWAEDELVDSGLAPDEIDLLSDLPKKTGNLLLLGVGGGREAIPLAKMGFHVTGVDYVPAMVELTIENGAKRGVHIEGLVQEISKLEAPPETYDVIWISRSMYSCVPTRERRVEMVKRIACALKPDGYFLCQFHRGKITKESAKLIFLRRLIAACTLGNTKYEKGDMLHLNVEFLHAFSEEDTLRSELEEGGFEVVHIQTDINPIRGGAVCRKPLAIP